MTCRCTFAIALATCAGCAEDIPTLYATGTALTSTELAPPADHIPMGFGHYRWALVELPPGQTGGDLSAETPSLSITPPARGLYVFDRWFVGDSGQQLSYHVVLTVDGAAPTARVVGPTAVAVAAATMLDGSTSSSPEQLPLTFLWRLAIRPGSSVAELGDVASASLSFVPDVAGEYDLELRVFDGELWSAPAMVALEAR